MQNPEADRNRRILVIDDNTAIHEDFQKILLGNAESQELADAAEAFFGETSNTSTQVEVQLDCASQGEEGLKLVKQALADNKPFAMAFVDMRMPPGWDGLRTITELWKVDPELQVVICSAYSDQSWSEIREQLGESDRLLILKKPFDNAEVLQLSTALIEKRYLTNVANAKAQELEALVDERTKGLHKAKEESELLLTAIDSMLIGLNDSGEVTRWNQSAQAIFGVVPEQAIGKQFMELPIRWDEQIGLADLMTQKSCRFETSFLDADDQQRFVGLSSYPVLDGTELKGTLILGSDLTEHRALESQLQQAQKLESVGQLAAGVAHEINTPMQYLGDNLDFLEKKTGKLQSTMDNLHRLTSSDCDDTSRQEVLEQLAEDAKKLKPKKLLDGLLDAITDSRDGVKHVSKIVRAMKEFAHPGQEEKMHVDINRALESTIAVSTNEWKYVATVNTDFDTTMPAVSALAVELNQVFLNILVNAAHAVGDTLEGDSSQLGTISVTTKAVDEHVEVTITDSGTGIPDDVKKRIFDPFFTTKEIGKGTGQGLAIAHSVIVNKHGGRLWCESTPGQGTTFHIHIPIEGEQQQAEESQDCLAEAV